MDFCDIFVWTYIGIVIYILLLSGCYLVIDKDRCHNYFRENDINDIPFMDIL